MGHDALDSFFAHSRNAAGARHSLVAHLRATAQRARAFADTFSAGDLGYAAGLLHDVGKFHTAFQDYLRCCEEHGGGCATVDHKAAGAQLGLELHPSLPLVILGHHGGLPPRSDVLPTLADPTIQRRKEEAIALAREVFRDLGEVLPMPLSQLGRTDAELFVRMLFSCLVDADFLDTEAHFNPERAAQRPGAMLDASAMLPSLRAYRNELNARADSDPNLLRLRTEIADKCEEAGERSPGIYRMTVPTGGGKTLAGMGFALRHAARHGKRRVIVAVPYTSITEQTAGVYRAVFGEGAVLEHHSEAQWDDPEIDASTRDLSWQRLAAENWDAPIVVTTTVQLFESLLGHRPGTSRKLHNIAGSVLILDEVQMLPPRLLDTILDVLRCLAEVFGTTVLLSTATRPDFSYASFTAEEIAPDPARTFALLRRVRYRFEAGEWTWEDAAAALHRERQAMMVLNTKKDALRVLRALDDDGVLHLSTNLCGAHRRQVLAEVQRRLRARERCLLVSTQVVEAGVDLDFPAVYRAMGPLDRIIQAAGRCNREGRLAEGLVTVFRLAEGSLPPGTYQTATQLTAIQINSAVDLHDPEALLPWFRAFLDTVETDAEGIQALRARMDFPKVSRCFRMIQDDTEDIVVPYGTADERALVGTAMESLRERRGSPRHLMRRIRPYTVSLRRQAIRRSYARGYVRPVIDGVWEWTGPAELYDGVCGLIADGSDEELLLV